MLNQALRGIVVKKAMLNLRPTVSNGYYLPIITIVTLIVKMILF